MYSDGSTSSVLMCVVLPCSDNFDGGVDAPAHVVACGDASAPPEFPCSQNATSSITLHSVSKLRLTPGIRVYLRRYAQVYSWK
jgi:hypothetical protein